MYIYMYILASLLTSSWPIKRVLMGHWNMTNIN